MDISPTSLPSAFALITRLIILPLRVFGTSETNHISSGFAILPSSFATCCCNFILRSSEGSIPFFRTTYDVIDSPFNSWGLPITAASATSDGFRIYGAGGNVYIDSPGYIANAEL